MGLETLSGDKCCVDVMMDSDGITLGRQKKKHMLVGEGYQGRKPQVGSQWREVFLGELVCYQG